MSNVVSIEPWQRARERYLEGLSDQEKQYFSASTPETLYYSVDAAQKLHSDDSKSRAFSQRLRPLIDTIEQYGRALDVFVNAAAVIMSPLWGSLRVLLIMASEFERYYGKLVDMLARIGDVLPRFSTYARLYSNHENLLEALAVVYLDVISFCMDARKVFEQGRKHKFFDLRPFKPLWKKFDRQFGDVIENFRHHKDNVEREAGLSHMIEAASERSAQSDERTVTLARREKEDKAKSEEKRRYILEQLSSADRSSNYKHRLICKRKNKNTGKWVENCKEYKEWINGSVSSCLWCYGIPGCGKTFVTSTVVDTLLPEINTTKTMVTYYYCDYSEKKTLDAVEIFGNLARQLLSATKITDQIERKIMSFYEDGSRTPDALEVLNILMDAVSLHKVVYLVLDGLDECHGNDRVSLLSGIQSLANPTSGGSIVKAFVASRADVDIDKAFSSAFRLHISRNYIMPDILSFTSDIVRVKIESGELAFNDDALTDEIVQALAEGAQGMFLWVAFQVADICDESTVQGIRNALRSLPRDLYDTYRRILRKICSREPDIAIAKKAFRWIAVARRPLLMEELREAISIEPGDKSLIQEKIIKDNSRLLRACGNLVVFDDEDRTVRLAHHTVAEFFFSSGSLPSSNPEFSFSRSEADLEIGEICATFLLFDEFERQVARTREAPPINARGLHLAIMQEVLLGGNPVQNLLASFSRIQLGFKSRRNMHHMHLRVVDRVQDSYELRYRLLSYVIENWLSHFSGLSRDSRAWNLFKVLVVKELPFSFKPWREDSALGMLPAFNWAVQAGHMTLLLLIEELSPFAISQYCETKDKQGNSPLDLADSLGHQEIFDYLLENSSLEMHTLDRVFYKSAEARWDLPSCKRGEI